MEKGYVKFNKGYTLIGIAFVMAIILILGSIAVASYLKCLEKSKEGICVTNVKVLKNAVELYIIENEAMPAVLGDLKLENPEKGYAQAMEDSDWLTNFSHFFC
ncbi:MAG: hypothetical protein U9N83_11975 [Thermodesulfobacteriota bacterium]|nr:hypothetical protein [Thermodesulfobacteriota bacterium]